MGSKSFGLLVVLAALFVPATAQVPLTHCCTDELESWEGYERGNGFNKLPDEQFPDIWQRISSKMSLGYHLHRSSVRTELDRFVRYLPALFTMLEESSPYLYYVVNEVEKRNLPMEIALLPFIESQFLPHTSSEYGATGIWQFMPSTARHFRMEMSWWFDDRRDLIASTNKALDYLEFLAQRFDGDWLLAIAAYNTGPRRVQEIQIDSVKRGQPKEFWALNLPRQTRRYVPAMIALAEIVRWGEVNGRPLPHIPNKPHFSVIDLPVQMDLLEIIQLSGLSVKEFFALNAGFKRWAPNPAKPSRVLLPNTVADGFSRLLAEHRGPAKINWVAHLIRPGDNLTKIARLFGCRVSDLRQLNGLLQDLNPNLEAGRYLLVPVDNAGASTIPRGGLISVTTSAEDSVASLAERTGLAEEHIRQSAGLAEGEELTADQRFFLLAGPEIPDTTVAMRSAYYQIRAGDTLSSIANRFDTTVSELMNLNEKTSAALYPGTRIRIPLRETP